MDPAYIVPFISSIQNVFSTMLQLPVEVGEPHIKNGQTPSYDVSGIIGMSGDVVGTVVLSFPEDTAQRVVALFTGTELSSDHADFADAIGELVNMVSGGAKAMFGGKKVSISCPSVVLGSGHIVTGRSDVPCVCVPVTTDCGKIQIELAIQEREAAAKAA